MKEITRIHIAKVPYDAEVEAKKALESYLHTLEAYSNDTEIINDIEIRITEILAERNVSRNGVVTLKDVTALKEQLGEPKDFMGEGDIAIGPDEAEQLGNSSKKLYRDIDNAVVGGVMSGIGAFFSINPTWIRLLFIILAFASFGIALLVYIVLWIVVPAAKTAADKLQMTGRPVTIASIRELNENEDTRSVHQATGRRVLTILAGIVAVLGALGSIAVVGVGIFGISFDGHTQLFEGEGAGFFIAAFVLAIISGLLLVTLFILAAYAAFSQKLTRRVIISSIFVIIMGLVTFGVAVGLAQYGSDVQRQIIEKNTQESALSLPVNAKTATSLAVNAPGFNVQYIVDNGESRATLRTFADDGAAIPKMNVTLEGTTLSLTSDSKAPRTTCYWPTCKNAYQNVTIFGPALQSVEAHAGSYVNYSAKKQSNLQIKANEESNLTVDAGTINNLSVEMLNGSTVSAGQAAVAHAKLTLASDLVVNLGTVETLEVTYPISCPTHKKSDIVVWDAKSVMINGSAQSIESADLTCLQFVVEGDKNDRS